MPHIHTQPGEHDATASAFIVRLDTPDPKLLLHMHRKLHLWLQPGGHIELLQTPWEAVLDEITQETGYEQGQLKILQPKQRIMRLTGVLLHPQPVNQQTHNFDEQGQHKHTDIEYAFATWSEPSGLIADRESKQLEWFDLEALRQIPPGTIPESVREVGEYVLTVCAPTWEQVPVSQFERS